MARYASCYRSKYLNATDLSDGDVRLVIKDAQEQVFKNQQTRKDEKKVVVSFHDSDQLLALNKINYKSIVDQFGYDLDEWADREIVLYSTPCQGPQGMTQGIRVRPARPARPARPSLSRGGVTRQIPDLPAPSAEMMPTEEGDAQEPPY